MRRSGAINPSRVRPALRVMLSPQFFGTEPYTRSFVGARPYARVIEMFDAALVEEDQPAVLASRAAVATYSLRAAKRRFAFALRREESSFFSRQPHAVQRSAHRRLAHCDSALDAIARHSSGMVMSSLRSEPLTDQALALGVHLARPMTASWPRRNRAGRTFNGSKSFVPSYWRPQNARRPRN